MIAWYWLWLPMAYTVSNRYWRGEGRISRMLWYYANLFLGLAISQDYWFSLIWLLFMLGYGLAPWHTMFSAVTGRPPFRTDSKLWRWMLKTSYYIYDVVYSKKGARNWRRVGAIFGTVRATLMLPAVFGFAFYLNSAVPLVGFAFLGMGGIYYLAANVRAHFSLREDIAIPIAEAFMGWMIGSYLLICASQLQ